MKPEIQIVDPGVPGLSVVLGGGVSLLKRTRAADPSGTLLLRGPPGSGKTLLGLHVAVGVADRLGGDVCYGCVEILPVEIHAQASAFGLEERVVEAPFDEAPPSERTTGRVFTALLDLGAHRQEQTNLGEAISAFLGAAGRAGARTRVLVLDSLSDGYSLGASAPRELVDAVCKLAAELGLFLVLLEETTDTRPSVWSFAVDAVIELDNLDDEGAASARTSAKRRLRVVKNRFGESDANTHRLNLSSPPICVLPWPSLYLRPAYLKKLSDAFKDALAASQSWPFEGSEQWPDFNRCVTVVYGPESHRVAALALALGITDKSGNPVPGRDVRIDLGSATSRAAQEAAEPLVAWGGHPDIDAHSLTSMAIAILSQKPAAGGPGLRRVILGDLRALRTRQDPRSLWTAIYTFAGICRSLHVPLVLYTTAEPRMALRTTAQTEIEIPVETGIEEPPAVDLADVVIEVRSRSSMSANVLSYRAVKDLCLVGVTEVYTGRRLRDFTPWEIPTAKAPPANSR